MKHVSILIAAMSGLSGAAYAGPLTNGAASLVTIRGCTAGDTSSNACYAGFGTGLSQASNGHRIAGVNQTNYDGGIGQSVSNVDYVGVYGESKARSEYAGPLDMPVLGVSSQASYNAATAINGNPLQGFRLGSHALNYQTYQYDGASASPFSLEVSLHYITSGYTTIDPNGQVSSPGVGLIGAELYLFDPAVLFAPIAGIDYPDSNGYMVANAGERLFDHITGGPCQAGALGYASASSSAAGEVTTTFKLSTALKTDGSCDDSGNPLTLLPGQQFGIMAILHSYSSRGGFADSFGTLSVALDPDLPAEVQQQLNSTLVSATDTEVPEPAMLGLFGLGAVGLGVMRRRRTV